MRRTDNYAANQIRLLLTELNQASHTDKKKALATFQTYVETYHPEVADENVDYLFTGCINGKLGKGLLYWGGVASDGKGSQLKRICSHVVRLIRWLVTHESESERGNFYYTRFIQLQLVDLKLLNFPKHVTAKKKKKKRGDDEDENEDIFVLVAILVNEHRTPQGKLNRLEVDDLLLFDEDANALYSDWVNSGAIEQIPNYRGGKNREDAVDRPATWEEVAFKVVPLQEGEEDVNELEEEPEVIPPIPDPLGISSVDLRSIQSFYASGRLMKSQTGQLARRATNAVMPIGGATPSGGRKTSFRASTTFVPYKHEDADSDNSDEDSDFDDDGPEPSSETVKPSFGGGDGAGGEEGQAGDGAGASNGAEGGRPALVKSRSDSAVPGREKKAIPSVVPSDKNFSTVLFLTLVHGSASFNQLKAGQDHLQQHLMLQSSRRENLVRMHFGLFVQCAEGLEFLKAFRKGVLKGTAIRQRRATQRKSVVTEAETKRQGQLVGVTGPAGTNLTDKGLERLKRSQSTLDAAKVEAQRTLAPILERMKQSRRIKSAEKVLRRMTAILEYPVRMRTALDRGDLTEVVSLYQRVQAVPTSSSSLRILHKIKEAAGLVVADLKKQCFCALMAPNANYQTLLRYGQIWMDLEGEGSYSELLRQCMIRQVLHFVDRIRELRDKFVAECADANDRGLEQNLLRRSPFLSGAAGGNAGDRESVAALVRRKAEQANNRKRQSARLRGNSNDLSEVGNRGRTTSESVVGNQWNEDDDDNFQENVDEFEVDGAESDDDWLDEDEELEDEFVDGNMDDLAFLDDMGSAGAGAAAGGGPKRKSLTFSDEVQEGHGRTVESTALRNNANQLNHSLMLCALVRHSTVEAMVDLLAKWFPCMFRLVSALSNLQNGSGSGTAPPAPLVKSATKGGAQPAGAQGQSTPGNKAGAGGGGGAATYTNLNRGAIAPSRILGAALKIYGDHLKQIISGIELSYTILTLPSELISAFNEVDSFIAGAHYPVQSVSTSVIALTNAMKVENKTFDSMTSSVLSNPLREPFHRDALQEVFELYNAMEFIIKREASAAGVNTGTAVGNLNTRVPFGAAGGTKNHLNFLSPTSPYYDSMNTLQMLSKEGEMALAQKIMDKLLELSAQVCTYDPAMVLAATNGTTAGASGALGRAASAASGYLDAAAVATTRARRRGSLLEEAVVAPGLAERMSGYGMEHNVTELGDLIMRCLRSVRTKVKREEWVAVVVQEGVQRVFSTFVEALRRESLKVSDGHATQKSRDSILAGAMVAPNRGRRSGTNMRSSISNGLVLETLEEELKFTDADQNRARLQLDLLRACIRLRCNCIPMIGNEIKLVFALPEDEDKATTPHAADKRAAAEAAAKAAAAAASAAAGNGLLSRTKSSLMTKLFAGTNDKDSDPPSVTPVTAVTESPARSSSNSNKEKKKLTLLNILLQFVKASDVDLFDQNLREVVAIEDQAATTYVNIKCKEIRTTVFAGYALLVHNESCNAWQALPQGAAVRLPVHLARILLSLGNEKKLLADALGDLKVMRGDTVPEEAEPNTDGDGAITPGTGAAASGPAAAGPAAPTVGRSLFASAEDSGSESDDNVDTAAKSARKEFCESLLYRDHLYKHLCVGLLQVYRNLIAHLRSNAFTDHSDAAREAAAAAQAGARRPPQGRRKNRVRADMFTGRDGSDGEEDLVSSEGETLDAGACKVPMSLGQAIEEHRYLKELLMPLLTNDMTIPYAEVNASTAAQAQEATLHRYAGRMYPSADQLMVSGKMFSVLINATDR